MKTKKWLLRLQKNFFSNFQSGAFLGFYLIFCNKFVKQFAISKDHFLYLDLKNFWEERSHLCKSKWLEP